MNAAEANYRATRAYLDARAARLAKAERWKRTQSRRHHMVSGQEGIKLHPAPKAPVAVAVVTQAPAGASIQFAFGPVRLVAPPGTIIHALPVTTSPRPPMDENLNPVLDAIRAYGATRVLISPEMVDGLRAAVEAEAILCTVEAGEWNEAAYWKGIKLVGKQVQVSG